LKNEEQTLVLEKQLLEDSEIHLKVEISCRDTVIEELETQLDQRDRATASSSSSSHQTYDQILKQLFPVVLYRRKAQAARYCYAVGFRARILAGGRSKDSCGESLSLMRLVRNWRSITTCGTEFDLDNRTVHQIPRKGIHYCAYFTRLATRGR
uniref:FERM domain-containing protein n=1 Tax=Toxocara canis TaxID=6265 RepID=A0A183VBD3_TOXCA